MVRSHVMETQYSLDLIVIDDVSQQGRHHVIDHAIKSLVVGGSEGYIRASNIR
jgi:hypothetical protein